MLLSSHHASFDLSVLPLIFFKLGILEVCIAVIQFSENGRLLISACFFRFVQVRYIVSNRGLNLF
jgi:hypothetical protein